MKIATYSLPSIMLALVLATTGTGVAFGQGTLTPEQMSMRVERLTELSQRSEEKLGVVQEQMMLLTEEMSRMGRLVDNRAVVDMIQQVDQLSTEISQLTGAIEEQRFEIESIKKRQRELYADIDRRLRNIESGATAPAASSSSRSQGGSGSNAVQQASSAAASAGAATTGQAASSSAQTTASLAPAGSNSGAEQAAYEAAFNTLKEGRYKNAKSELRAFLDRYPNSGFAGNAQYWLGEAHYVTRSFQQGITEFSNVLNKYPASNKVPDAMLKLGYTYYELQQYAEAKQILLQLRERFPGETAANLADKRLERMRKEGH